MEICSPLQSIRNTKTDFNVVTQRQRFEKVLNFQCECFNMSEDILTEKCLTENGKNWKWVSVSHYKNLHCRLGCPTECIKELITVNDCWKNSTNLSCWTLLTFQMNHASVSQSMKTLRILVYGQQKIPFSLVMLYMSSRMEHNKQWPSARWTHFFHRHHKNHFSGRYILIAVEMKFTASKIDETPVRCRPTYSISSLDALICRTLLDSCSKVA
jgi:hypothetical protein